MLWAAGGRQQSAKNYVATVTVIEMSGRNTDRHRAGMWCTVAKQSPLPYMVRLPDGPSLPIAFLWFVQVTLGPVQLSDGL